MEKEMINNESMDSCDAVDDVEIIEEMEEIEAAEAGVCKEMAAARKRVQVKRALVCAGVTFTVAAAVYLGRKYIRDNPEKTRELSDKVKTVPGRISEMSRRQIESGQKTVDQFAEKLDTKKTENLSRLKGKHERVSRTCRNCRARFARKKKINEQVD